MMNTIESKSRDSEKRRFVRSLVDSAWTPVERSVWKKLLLGERVDLTEGRKTPELINGRDVSRDLSSKFMKTILTSAACLDKLTSNRIHIVGAHFPDGLNLASADISCELNLERSHYGSKVDLKGLTSSTNISFIGSDFKSLVDMASMIIEGSLILTGIKSSNTVQLTGTKVCNQLYLNNACLKSAYLTMDYVQVEGSSLSLDRGEFNGINLVNAKIGGVLSFIESSHTGDVNMGGVRVGGSLFMDDGAMFCGAINLNGAKIQEKLSMKNSTCESSLSMIELVVHGRLEMNGGMFKSINLEGAKVEGGMSLAQSVVGKGSPTEDKQSIKTICKGFLSMRDLSVNGPLDMSYGRYNGINMIRARIGDTLSLVGSTHDASVDMKGVYIRGSLFMDRGTTFKSEVILNGAEVQKRLSLKEAIFEGEVKLNEISVGSFVDLTQARFLSGLEMKGSIIGGSLNLSGTIFSQNRIGEKGIDLDLRNSSANAVRADKKTKWPISLELHGFHYSHLEDETADRKTLEMNAEWSYSWLEKQKTFSPGSYHQLASALERIGQSDKANDVRYAGKERERNERVRFSKSWWAMSLLNWTIGYGYGARYFRSLYWVSALTVVGAGVYVSSISAMPMNLSMVASSLVYSLDMLLPIVTLNESHKLDQLSHGYAYYFYLHKVMGYVLASFLIAGLSGLSKK